MHTNQRIGCRFCIMYLFILIVDGNWGEWSNFEMCTVSCGGGSQIRRRVCDDPPAQFGGRHCLLSGSETERATEETDTQLCGGISCPGKEIQLLTYIFQDFRSKIYLWTKISCCLKYRE